MSPLPNFKLSVLAVLIFAGFCLAGDENGCVIFLRSGDSIPFIVSQVNTWGITNEKGETASFKVVDSLYISDGSTAEKIKKIDDRIEIRQTSSGFILDFQNYIPPKYPTKQTKLMVPNSLSISYHHDRGSRLGLGYDFSTLNSEPIFFRLQVSMGYSPDIEVYSSLKLSLGLGLKSDYGNLLVSMFTSYGKIGEGLSEVGKTGLGSVFFITPTISYQIYNEYGLYMLGGFDLYLYRSRGDLPKDPIIIFIGLGKKLN